MTDTLFEFSRPSEEDERRALTWLMDRRDWSEHRALERRYAATLIQTLAWFEQLEGAMRAALAGSPVGGRNRGNR